ncbi:MAG: GNAT family N-acetyltransferase [Planctomycetes bacterium]|nr:GNAT family N-acetyltransferase [Planctomycetota bacterium]
MPLIESKKEIRAILDRDRVWSLYALADLDDGLNEKCRWRAPASGEPALVLLYSGFDPHVLFAIGESEPVAALLDEFDSPSETFLHIPLHVLPLIAHRCMVRKETPMWRMVLKRDALRPVNVGDVVRLDAGDLPHLNRLYADGDVSADSPDFFDDLMVENGVFYGVREGDDLVAAAGTHVLSCDEGTAGIGNIYTRRGSRGRGLGARTTTAVVSELLGMGIRTIGLNVAQSNMAAIRLYERLGFACHCPFVEGIAVRR